MRWLLEFVWNLRGKPLIRVGAGMSPIWRDGNMPPQRACTDEQGCEHYTFSVDTAIMLVKFLVDNAFVQVGDTVYRQIRGIPMGIGPAMYFANYCLAVCEFLFFRDALQVLSNFPSRQSMQRTAIVTALKSFQFVSRYADNI